MEQRSPAPYKMGQKNFFESLHFKNVFYSKSVYTVEVKNIKLQGYEIYNNKEYRAATSEDQSPLHYALQTSVTRNKRYHLPTMTNN